MSKGPRRFQRALALPLLMTVSTTMSACGDDDTSTSSSPAAPAATATNPEGEKATITVALTPVSAGACLKVSDERGLFKRRGLTLKFAPPPATSAAQVAQILNGQLTAGFGAYTAVISAVSNNLGIVMTNSMDRDKETATAILAAKDEGITTFRDLEGKTVGVNSLQGSWEVMTKEAIAKDGGDPSKVKLVPIGFADQAAALKAGRVDAITTAQPLIALLADGGYVDIGNPQAAMMGTEDSAAGGIFMAKSYVEENGEVVKNFVDASQEGNTFCNDPKNREFMTKAIVRITETPRKIVEKAPLPNFSATLSSAETDMWSKGLSKYGIIKDVPTPAQVQWSGALPKQ